MDKIEGTGPFITNGELRETECLNLDMKIASVTALMFNLDNLNKEHPEVLPNSTWNRGQIPESPSSMIETLVQQVDKGRFKFEVGIQAMGHN